jgi:hypothetical protein
MYEKSARIIAEQNEKLAKDKALLQKHAETAEMAGLRTGTSQAQMDKPGPGTEHES